MKNQIKTNRYRKDEEKKTNRRQPRDEQSKRKYLLYFNAEPNITKRKNAHTHTHTRSNSNHRQSSLKSAKEP